MKKDITLGQPAKNRLLAGIKEISDAVCITLGPLGNTVIIEDRNTPRGVRVTKDGVTVAKHTDVVGSIENLAVTIVREAAERTAVSSGDGTTTSILLAYAMVQAGMVMIEKDKKLNVTKLIKDIKKATDHICEDLKKEAIPITNKNMENIAIISCNNDKTLGKMIANAYKGVGKDGVVTPRNSPTAETYFEVTKGIKIERGYTSPLFKTDAGTGDCTLDDVYILITDIVVDQMADLEDILKPIIQGKKGLLIIGECSQAVINALGANVVSNKMKFCHIEKPSFGWKTQDLMEDIAHGTGGRFISQSTGDDLSLVSMTDLGHVDKIIVDKERCILIIDKSIDTSKRVKEIRASHKKATKQSDKDFFKERIAKLSGGVGVVFAGGDTTIEQKEMYDRIDDAVRAVESAREMGILPGGGVALRDKGYSRDMMPILSHSLISPYEQIFKNGHQDVFNPTITKTMAMHGEDSVDIRKGYGMDLMTGKKGDMIEMGIIDPAKVTINALKNAVSVATAILSTNAVLSAYESDKQVGPN